MDVSPLIKKFELFMTLEKEHTVFLNNSITHIIFRVTGFEHHIVFIIS